MIKWPSLTIPIIKKPMPLFSLSNLCPEIAFVPKGIDAQHISRVGLYNDVVNNVFRRDSPDSILNKFNARQVAWTHTGRSELIDTHLFKKHNVKKIVVIGHFEGQIGTNAYPIRDLREHFSKHFPREWINKRLQVIHRVEKDFGILRGREFNDSVVIIPKNYEQQHLAQIEVLMRRPVMIMTWPPTWRVNVPPRLLPTDLLDFYESLNR